MSDLQQRKYVTWFDVECMKGSTIDACVHHCCHHVPDPHPTDNIWVFHAYAVKTVCGFTVKNPDSAQAGAGVLSTLVPLQRYQFTHEGDFCLLSVALFTPCLCSAQNGRCYRRCSSSLLCCQSQVQRIGGSTSISSFLSQSFF